MIIYELPMMAYEKFPAIWVTESHVTCQYTDYLLDNKVDDISITKTVGDINWEEILSMNTMF